MRYNSLDGSQESPNAASKFWQTWKGSHKYGRVVSMRAVMSSERSVALLVRVFEAVMDSTPIIRLCESLPASGKLGAVGTKREEV